MGTGASPQGPDSPDQCRPDQELQRRAGVDTKGRVGRAPAVTAPGPCSSKEQQRERKPTGHKVASHTVACRPKGPQARAVGGKDSRTAPRKSPLPPPPHPHLPCPHPGTLSNSPASALRPKSLGPARPHRGREGGLLGRAVSPTVLPGACFPQSSRGLWRHTRSQQAVCQQLSPL